MVTLCTCAQLKMQCRDIEFMDWYCRGCEEQDLTHRYRAPQGRLPQLVGFGLCWQSWDAGDLYGSAHAKTCALILCRNYMYIAATTTGWPWWLSTCLIENSFGYSCRKFIFPRSQALHTNGLPWVGIHFPGNSFSGKSFSQKVILGEVPRKTLPRK